MATIEVSATMLASIAKDGVDPTELVEYMRVNHPDVYVGMLAGFCSVGEVQWKIAAVDALSTGRFVDAVRMVRAATGLGLKESKLACDYYSDHGEWNI